MTALAAVITCSDSAFATPDLDRSGPEIAQLLASFGFASAQRTIVPDDAITIAGAVRSALAAGCRVVVCTGGTGIGPRDVTPEAIALLAGRALPGIGEAIRAQARGHVPRADLSRSGAFAVGDGFVLMLPGSPGGARDGLAIAGPLLQHALEMMDGHGHNAPAQHSIRGSHAPLVCDASIEPQALLRELRDSGSGALVTFEGRVRDHDRGRSVRSLSYEQHPGANAILADLVATARSQPGVIDVVARHRVGHLAIGDLAFFVAASAAHRGEAFETCRWLVDEAKDRLPIWKHQIFDDGKSEWVNAP